MMMMRMRMMVMVMRRVMMVKTATRSLNKGIMFLLSSATNPGEEWKPKWGEEEEKKAAGVGLQMEKR